MPVDLAQRLIYADAVARHDVEAALLRYAKHGVPFLSALLELRPQLEAALESELNRIAGGEVQHADPDPELVARLPDGLCSQLLGYPVAVSGSTGTVDVLIADPLDAHAGSEFSFHLRAPIRLIRGSLRPITEQLVVLEGKFAPLTARQDRERMNDALPVSNVPTESAPPIPLVRLVPQLHSSPPLTAVPNTRPGVAPPAQEVTGSRAPKFVDALTERGAEKQPVEPVSAHSGTDGQQHRGKGAGQENAREAESSRPQPKGSREPSGLSERAPVSAALDPLAEEGFESALSDLAIADDPESVVEALVVGLSSVCEEVVVFAVRGTTLRSRCRADRYGDPEKITTIDLPETAPSCASAASRMGQFLGPPVDADRLIFSMPAQEVSATAVRVGSKPALVVCISGFGNAYEATRRADHLARAASDALSRIVLARKR